ncbi:MAG: hypothetical protein ACK5S9_08880, partial [Roseiflexaceae bacterium]
HTARELEVTVPAAFRELQILEVPTCRPEPAQIVDALNRVRDAELLAFIEMSTAEAGGSSREMNWTSRCRSSSASWRRWMRG